MKRLLVTLLLLLPAVASAQLYHPGEELHYSVSYRARFFPNTEVATVTVRTSEESFEGREVRKVVGHGKTLPTYRLFFPRRCARSNTSRTSARGATPSAAASTTTGSGCGWTPAGPNAKSPNSARPCR